jgi:hypothetical protein
MRSTVTILLALVSLIPVAPLGAQIGHTGLVGSRVRITMPDTMRNLDQPAARPLVVIGKLVAMSDSTMLIRNDASTADVAVPLSRVQRLEVGRGSDRGRTARIGGAIGLGFGGILGYVAGDDCSSEDFICFPREETALVGAAIGAVLGAGIGFLAGGERWQEAAVPTRVSIVPTGARSMVITSTLRF